MLHRLILKVTKFQLLPPKRLNTVVKNILGGGLIDLIDLQGSRWPGNNATRFALNHISPLNLMTESLFSS